MVAREHLAVEWRLHPLSLAETEHMIRAIFEQPRPIRKEFLDLMYAMTEGNPFFIEEIVRALAETGALIGAKGSYSLGTAIDRIRIPGTVRTVSNTRAAASSGARLPDLGR